MKVVPLTVKIERMLWASVARLFFGIGAWCLRRVTATVSANGKPIRTMHPAATVEVRIEQGRPT